MDYFKQIFLKLLEYLKITGDEAAQMTDDFLNQVNSRFIEEYLSKKLPKDQFDAKVEEYKKLLTENKLQDIQTDLKNHIQDSKDIGEVYADAFSKHIQAFLIEMQKEGEIKPEQFAEIENLLRHTVKNVNLQYKVEVSKKEGKIEDVLKSISQ